MKIYVSFVLIQAAKKKRKSRNSQEEGKLSYCLVTSGGSPFGLSSSGRRSLTCSRLKDHFLHEGSRMDREGDRRPSRRKTPDNLVDFERESGLKQMQQMQFNRRKHP